MNVSDLNRRVSAARAEAEPEPWFLAIGPQDLHERLRYLASKHQFGDQLTLLDSVARSEIPAYLPMLDCGMVLLKKDCAHMAPTALQLKEMLLANVPCLVNVPASWRSTAPC